MCMEKRVKSTGKEMIEYWLFSVCLQTYPRVRETKTKITIWCTFWCFFPLLFLRFCIQLNHFWRYRLCIERDGSFYCDLTATIASKPKLNQIFLFYFNGFNCKALQVKTQSKQWAQNKKILENHKVQSLSYLFIEMIIAKIKLEMRWTERICMVS